VVGFHISGVEFSSSATIVLVICVCYIYVCLKHEILSGYSQKYIKNSESVRLITSVSYQHGLSVVVTSRGGGGGRILFCHSRINSVLLPLSAATHLTRITDGISIEQAAI
jgi:hypothetical protein